MRFEGIKSEVIFEREIDAHLFVYKRRARLPRILRNPRGSRGCYKECKPAGIRVVGYSCVDKAAMLSSYIAVLKRG